MSNPFKKNQTLTSWDTITLGDVILPGIVQQVNIQTIWEYDKPKNLKTSGGKSVFKGKPLREPIVIIKIWTETQYDEWKQIWSTTGKWRDLISGKTAQPLQVVHPELNQIGINTVVITGIINGLPSQIDGLEIGIEMLEWVDEKTATNNNTVKKAANQPTRRTPAYLDE